MSGSTVGMAAIDLEDCAGLGRVDLECSFPAEPDDGSDQGTIQAFV